MSSYLRFLRFMFVATVFAGVEGLSNRQVPSSTQSAADQASFGRYMYGESLLFGGSDLYSTSNLWAGKKADAERKEHGASINAPTSFLPNNADDGSSFTPPPRRHR